VRRAGLTTVLGAAALTGCGSTTQGAMQQIVPPDGGNAAVINCLTEQASAMGYKILRKDPGDGFLEAERRQKDFAENSPKQYAQGDRLDVQRGKKGPNGTRPLELTMTSFRMDFLANGAQQTKGAPTPQGKADLQKFMEQCGPLAPGSSQ
jgi:hypothetical protein